MRRDTFAKVTPSTASRGSGTRTRAERPPRCGQPKSEGGGTCRRTAGSGTNHPGVGPCANHDDGAWEQVAFSENVEAQAAFLTAVRANKAFGIRDLVEPLGYKRRDVQHLLDSSQAFLDEYEEARGYDPDALRNEIRRRAVEVGSDRLLEFLGKMRLDEAQALLRTRFEGRLEVAAAPVIDTTKLTLEELETLRALLAKARPDPGVLPPEQRPALELLDGGA